MSPESIAGLKIPNESYEELKAAFEAAAEAPAFPVLVALAPEPGEASAIDREAA